MDGDKLKKRVIVPFMGSNINKNCASDNRKISLYQSQDGVLVEFHFLGSDKNDVFMSDKVSYFYHKNRQKPLFPRLSFCYRLLKYLKNNKKDLIYIEYPWGLLYFGIFFVLLKPRNVNYFIQDSEHPLVNMNILSMKTIAKYLSHYIFKFFIVKKAIFSIIMTKKLSELYESYGAKNIIHIPMTVDFERFNIKKHTSSIKYFAYCGTMNCKKDGVDILVRSFIKLAEEYNNIELLLIGPKSKNSEDDVIYDLIKRSKCSSRIRLLGEKKGEEIPLLLNEAFCLCLARPDSLQAQYGFPTKLGEYLATGNPVIVTNVGEIPLYLKDGQNAYVAEHGSVESFYEKMKECLENRNSEKIGINGRSKALEEFSSDKNSKLLGDFIKQRF